MKKLGIIGAGYLAKIVVEAYQKGMLEGYELVGITGRNKEHVDELAKSCGSVACRDYDELLFLKPEIIVEAASVAAVRESAEKILSHGCSMVVLSIGAFADQDYLNQVKRTADENHAKIYLTSGAVGGFDVLKTLSLMSDGDMEAKICTHKGPQSLKNTPLFEEKLMEEGEETEVFTGNAKEAIALLPTKVNVAVATALASAGPENTNVSICSVPGMTGDDHCITAKAAGCKTVIDTYSPTSAIAGWSVVALLQNLNSSIVVF